MTSDTDLPQQPDTVQHQSPCSFKSLKPLTLLTIVILISLVAVKGSDLFGSRRQQDAPPNQSSESAQTPTITELSTITKKQFNSSGTLAFYFTIKKPVFEATHDPQNRYRSSDNPFNLCFNGDTSYVIQSTIYPGNTYQDVITPYITETNSGKSWNLSFIGEVKAPNGCARITHWVDDTHLLRKACGGDLNEGCECHLVDVQKHSLKDLGFNGC
jgi:hypothetical protein